MNELISRYYAKRIIDSIDTFCAGWRDYAKEQIDSLPTIDAIEVVRCKDCIYGYLYIDVQNGVTDSWIECRNPEGLNRDVSVDGYCSAAVRRT